jgi:hypothetical protein
VFAFLLLFACASDPAPAPVDTALAGGWPALAASDPAALGALFDPQREGWIALHAGDWEAAAIRLEGAPRARALRHLAAVEGDLARLSALVWERTLSRWADQVGISTGSALPAVAALSRADAGDAAGAAAWLQRGGGYTDPDVTALASALASERAALDPAAALPSGVPGSLGGCVGRHQAVRSAAVDPGSSPELDALCPEGVLVREAATDHERVFYDPLVSHTRALVHTKQADAITATESAAPLPRLLFTAAWTLPDAEARAGGDALGPTLTALGLPWPPGPDDEVEPAREWVRALDARLDAWEAEQVAAATPEGQALYRDLQLVPVYRSRLLVEQTRRALQDGRPHQALAIAQRALDVEHARSVGPINPPELFALLAEANLRTGRTREAKDALAVLLPGWPWLRGLDETLGDLAVLEGIGRGGDSKE